MRNFAYTLILMITGFPAICLATENPMPGDEEFSVQIIASDIHLNPDDEKLKGFTDVHEEMGAGLYKFKYITGDGTKSLDEAAKIRLKMLEAGFKDAFVVKYISGQRVGVKGAVKKTDSNELSSTQPTSSVEKIVANLRTEKRIIKKNEKSDDEIQIQPQFPGGQSSLDSFISQNMHCPESLTAGTAKVTVGFVVSEDGKLYDIKVANGVSEDVDNEALRIVRLMPDWVPGKVGDQAYSMQSFIPIEFQNASGKFAKK